MHFLSFGSYEISVTKDTFLQLLCSVTDKHQVVAISDDDFYYYHFWHKSSNSFVLFGCSQNLYRIDNVICS